MKKMMFFAVLVIVSMTAFAQVSKEEQELIDLSNQKWQWMAEKNADRLSELFLENYSRIHLTAAVGGNEVVNPFIVSEVFVMEDGKWRLSLLAFTRTIGD